VPGIPVKVLDARGNQYGPTVFTDATGRYTLPHLPTTWNGLIVQATVGTDVLRTLSPAPGSRTLTADLGPASSGIAAVALDAQTGAAQTLGISRAAFGADVQTLQGLMTFADARFIVSNPTAAVAAYVRQIFATAGRPMQLGLPVPVAAPVTPPPTALPRPSGLGTATGAVAGTEIQIHGLNLPANAAGLRVDIGGVTAPFTRMPDPNDWFVMVPVTAPVGPTSLTIYFNDGVNAESIVLPSTPFNVQPAPPTAAAPTLTISLGSFTRGTSVNFTGTNLPPVGELGVTLGGVFQASLSVTPTTLAFVVDPATPVGSQQLLVMWYDPALGPHAIADEIVSVN
jgi:hypothetical protein